MKKILNHKFEVIGLLFFLCLFLYGMFESTNLKSRRKIAIAIVTGTSYSKGNMITYNFSIDSLDYRRRFKIGYSNTFEGMDRTDLSTEKIEKFFLNKKFPVVYDSIEIFNSDLLMFKKDFTYYNLAFPDSLKWVEKLR